MNTTVNPLRRSIYLIYGALCYACFLVTILYLVGFVGNYWRSFGWVGPLFRSMDFGGAPEALGQALLIDSLLVGLFAVQHSVMARSGFKAKWTRIVPAPIERSTFVLAASLCLALLFWQWRPIGTTVVWDFSGGPMEFVLIGLSLLGWLTVVSSTFMINHFDLFGLRQVWYVFLGKPAPETEFSTPVLYKAVRHPIYLGFVVAFWSTPLMTFGHLVFAAATTGFILVGIQLEERDLVLRYGDAYRQYRRRVRMLMPLPRHSRAPVSNLPPPSRPAGWSSDANAKG